MKINNTPTSKVSSTRSASTKRAGSRSGASSASSSRSNDTVSLSSDANFIQSVRTEASQSQGIRQHLVAETKNDLADGSFESKIDLDRAVNAILADL